MELDADDLGRLERERADVDVLSILVASEEVERDFDQLLGAQRDDHLQNAGVLLHALEVLW